ncbi:hypothetical protein QTP88_000337 [Uroleucon formosanum]
MCVNVKGDSVPNVPDWSDRLIATDLQWSETIILFPHCINIRYWRVLKMRFVVLIFGNCSRYALRDFFRKTSTTPLLCAKSY